MDYNREYIGDANPRAPDERADELAAIILRHFPWIPHDEFNLRPEVHPSHYIVLNLAGHADDEIRLCCARMSSVIVTASKRRGEKMDVIFTPKNSGGKSAAAILRRKLKAIDRADAKSFVKATFEEDDYVTRIIDHAEEEIDGHWPIRWIGDIARLLRGPSPESLARNSEFWEKQRAILTRAIEMASSRRRPPSRWQDDAIMELILLWHIVTRKRPTEPGYERKTPLDAPGTMTGFVLDGLKLYGDCGLGAHVWPGASRASWRRILLRVREELAQFDDY